MPAPTKIKMKEQVGVRDFCYSVISADTEEAFTPGTVKSGGWLAKVNINVSQETRKIHRDNKHAKTVYSLPTEEIIFDVSLLPLEVRNELLGEYKDKEDEVLFGGGGVRIPPIVSIAFVMGDTEEEEEYIWYLKGTFALPSREANTKNDGVESNGMELVFTPQDTIHSFTNGGKPRSSVVMYSTNTKYDLTKWFDQVVTPDNYKTVLAKSA